MKKWFDNINIGKRLLIIFTIISILVACFGIFTYYSLSQIHARANEMDSKWLLGVTYSNEVNTMSSDFRILELQHIQSTNMAEMADLEKEMDSKNAEIDNVFGKYVISNFEEDKNLFNTAKMKWKNYIELHNEVISLSRQLKNEEAMTLIKGRGKEAFDEASNALLALAQYNENNSARLAEETTNLYNSTVIVLIIVLLVILAISIFSGVFLVKSIVNPLKRMVNAAEKIADGDLSIKIDLEQNDEIGILLRALNRIIESLHRLTADANMLSNAAVEGKLDTRADASKHPGDYRKIVEGVNDTLDAVIIPIKEAEHVMKTMSLNDYTLEVKGQYKGLLQEFAESINSVRTRLLSVQDAVVRVSLGDTSRLDEFIKIGKRSENDKLMPAIAGMMQNIRNLIDEAGKLANAAVNGEMQVRGNADAFEGGYREIIMGMNKTMDAVAQPLQEASHVLTEMERGNLTVAMNGEYKGEYAKVKEAINVTVQTFNNILNDINTAAQQVASGSRQVSDSAQALSQGSTEQASSVEELTASLEEISVQTKQNATNANQANELAVTAKDNAVRGNEQMYEMLKAMEEINESSSNISKIIKVIDDIAFQTNILALNAAVEAARAGQHGKGFAVVAEEVRNLAARSANAAKETTGLIEGSIKKAEGGTKIANETATALNKIVDGITKAAELVGGITSASNEQAAAIAQVNQGIMQVSQVTQTNSATSEESAAASEELSSQAEVLNEMVGKFKLKKSSSIKSLDELNPDVIRMLESITEKKKAFGAHDKKADPFASKMKIALSDREFGKY